jgi:hypothetical protein
MIRQRLLTSPAIHYELPKLELPRAWEPSSNSRPPSDGDGKETQYENNIVFLMETKMCNKNLDFLRIKMKFDYIFAVDSVGRSGGLILMWRDDMKVVIQNYSRRHINVTVSMGRDGKEWKFSGVYGHPEVAKRKESWALMQQLATFSPKPWLCIGDFNEIINLSEKWGAVTRADRQMEAFRRTLEDCQLCDLGFKGPNTRGIMGVLEKISRNRGWIEHWATRNGE